MEASTVLKVKRVYPDIDPTDFFVHKRQTSRNSKKSKMDLGDQSICYRASTLQLAKCSEKCRPFNHSLQKDFKKRFAPPYSVKQVGFTCSDDRKQIIASRQSNKNARNLAEAR
ncbi:MAG: hypothetical protein EZS28_042903 [Streblomastix strix]|uniref:Uncharacterized protein n=1 Tax=Streblomastix strix TaxID=222440 RepID=A0A5J4TU87_9EUKA|nr:MAG: hypothetical protein EZS28_042903 [Streblomastix strix]